MAAHPATPVRAVVRPAVSGAGCWMGGAMGRCVADGAIVLGAKGWSLRAAIGSTTPLPTKGFHPPGGR